MKVNLNILFRGVYKYCVFFLMNISLTAYGQQDVDFHLNSHLLLGTKILKIKHDFNNPYLWVLAQNNQVFRINTATLAVDDLTATFSAYSSLQFVDIAGDSPDTVYIATNSSNVIQYKSGNIKLIGSSYGVNGTVNSIGFDLLDRYPGALEGTPVLMIATNTGIYDFDVNTEQPVWAMNNGGDSKIYEATYRKEMDKDSANNPNSSGYDTLKLVPVSSAGDRTIFSSYIWENNSEFGYNIHTAYYVTNTIYDYAGYPEAMDLFWGNANGMFQVQDNDSFAGIVSNHYLNNINVNKITGIYGLTSFGNGHQHGYAGLMKENLLIGTDVGLYFSNSLYLNYMNNGEGLHSFFMFHDDELGNIKINDIAVNPESTQEPICEDGVWLAADDGLYLLKPDYQAFFAVTMFKTVYFDGQPDTLSQIKLCEGTSTKAVLDTDSFSGKSFQWYKNGQEIPNQSTDTLKINSAGDYYAVLYDPCQGIHVESNHLTVQVISSPVFTFNYPDKMQECNSDPNILQTTYNPGYHYRWYTNGTLNGDTTDSCTVTQSGKYKVEVSACTNSWVPSKEVEVDMITLPVPEVTADKSIYCAEDVATLSVNTPIDASYTINWYQNGNLIAADANLTSVKTTTAGNYTATVNSNNSACTQTSAQVNLAFTPAPVFTFNYPGQIQYCTGSPLTLTAAGSSAYQYRWYKDEVLNNVTTASLAITQNGEYKVEVSSCAGSWVPSKEVEVNFVQLPAPVITADKPAYCIGDNATLALTTLPDPSYTINWYRDGTLLPGFTNQTSITTNVAGSYTTEIVNNTANTDGTTCSQNSAAQAISFNPPPIVSIKQTVNTTLCAGQTVSLSAVFTGGSVKWSTGETTDQITIIQSGHYSLTATSQAGCQADAGIDVNFLPDPIFSLKDTSICTFKKQIITLTAPPGFAAYNWNNGESSNPSFQVTQPQTVSLTVTDANGCQATQQVRVADQCPTVFIPNTFTPNGDGVNDTWVIEGLDETGTVKVFTRWGAEVYQSIGYSTPWSGEYAGKKLAPGVYYYIVTAKNDSQKFSGSLTIIY